MISKIMPAFGIAVAMTIGPRAHAQDADPPRPTITVFEDVTVVPMDTERLLEHHTVIVRDDRIMWVGPAAEANRPINATVIDGTGRYLMPGLVDMHVHTWDTHDLTLFLANGITSVRNLFGNPMHLMWRNQIASGALDGPTIYTAGPIVDGEPPIWPGSDVVTSAADADRVVRQQKAAGYDFIKVYNRLPLEGYNEVVRVAREVDIPVIGHVPDDVGLPAALDAHQHTIEHLTGYIEACYAGEGEPGNAFFNAAELADHYDGERLGDAIRRTNAAATWNCPTLVVLRGSLVPDEATGRRRAGVEYLSEFMLNFWRQREASEERREQFVALNDIWTDIARQLHAADARIVLGTDTPNPWVVPGFAIHRELANFIEIGMTPYEALAAGTKSAAECLDASSEFGTIANGLRADLLLLSANPLDDVANVRQRVGVMSRGRWYDEADLQTRLAALATLRRDDDGAPDEATIGLPPIGGCCAWHADPTDH